MMMMVVMKVLISGDGEGGDVQVISDDGDVISDDGDVISDDGDVQVISAGQTEGPEGVSLSLVETATHRTLQTVHTSVGGRSAVCFVSVINRPLTCWCSGQQCVLSLLLTGL